MSKEFSFPNKGTCSKQTNFVLNDDHTIASMEVIGGCNGNTQGVAKLAVGRPAQEVIDLLKDTDCNGRGTSCPAQLAKALEEAMNK